MTTRRVYGGLFGPLPVASGLGAEAASVAVALAQDVVARCVTAQERLEDGDLGDAITALRDAEADYAAVLRTAADRVRELRDAA